MGFVGNYVRVDFHYRCMRPQFRKKLEAGRKCGEDTLLRTYGVSGQLMIPILVWRLGVL